MYIDRSLGAPDETDTSSVKRPTTTRLFEPKKVTPKGELKKRLNSVFRRVRLGGKIPNGRSQGIS